MWMDQQHPGHQSDPDVDDQLRAVVGERLKEAFAALGDADIPAVEKGRWHQRLIAITNSSKHDLATAQRRLDAWFAELSAASAS